MFPDVLGVGKQVSFSYYTTKLSCDLRYVCMCVCVCVCVSVEGITILQHILQGHQLGVF
jgi:hypothetical protein